MDVSNTETFRTGGNVSVSAAMSAVEDPPNTSRAEWVGARVRARRRAIRMGQKAFAAAVGEERHNISRYENGHRGEPSQRKLERWAAVLGCQWMDFYTDKLDADGDLEPR